MRPFIRTLSLCAYLIFSCTALFAGNASVRPVSSLHSNFFSTVKKLDSTIMASPLTTASAVAHHKVAKICSCQILNLQSSNYQHNKVAVFAEKTNNGSFSSDSKAAKGTIEKEKKHLKQLFYDKLEVVNHIAENTDCKSLYLKLKKKDNALVMYDILDADNF